MYKQLKRALLPSWVLLLAAILLPTFVCLNEMPYIHIYYCPDSPAGVLSPEARGIYI
jgi:hypothetical protein